MGSSSAVLAPLGPARGGGVAVIVPELSVVLSVGAEISSELAMTQLPFQDAVSSSSSSKRGSAANKDGFMSQLFKGSSANSAEKLDPRMFRFAHATSGSSVIAMWYCGRNEIFFFDWATNTMVSATASCPIDAVRFAGAGEGPSSHWIARSLSGPPSTAASSMHFVRVSPGDAARPITAWRLSGDYCRAAAAGGAESGGSASVCDEGTLWGGGPELFAECLLGGQEGRTTNGGGGGGFEVDVWSRCSRSRVFALLRSL
jgi:hypothetical protein